MGVKTFHKTSHPSLYRKLNIKTGNVKKGTYTSYQAVPLPYTLGTSTASQPNHIMIPMTNKYKYTKWNYEVCSFDAVDDLFINHDHHQSQLVVGGGDMHVKQRVLESLFNETLLSRVMYNNTFETTIDLRHRLTIDETEKMHRLVSDFDINVHHDLVKINETTMSTMNGISPKVFVLATYADGKYDIYHMLNPNIGTLKMVIGYKCSDFN